VNLLSDVLLGIGKQFRDIHGILRRRHADWDWHDCMSHLMAIASTPDNKPHHDCDQQDPEPPVRTPSMRVAIAMNIKLTGSRLSSRWIRGQFAIVFT